MSSHVVVIDSKARRAVVKVTPAKHLSDILGEACSKLGVDPSQYGLKYACTSCFYLFCYLFIYFSIFFCCLILAIMC